MNKIKSKYLLSSFLIIQIVVVKILGQFPSFIEKNYSHGLYKKIAWCNRTVFGNIPFSFGDVIYSLLIILLIRWIWKTRKGFFKNWKSNGLTILSWFSVFYFLFHILWGMNYYRVPLHEKLNIEKEYTEEELLVFTEKMIAKTNALQLQITGNDSTAVKVPYSDEEVFAMAQNGYAKLPKSLQEFHYANESIKPSLLRYLLSYMGFGGYINPFTNEAQVNTLKPNFTLPMTTCHEMGHQVGIGSESECNFIGFIAASNHDDLYFQYSAYSFITNYCLGNLERIEEGKGKAFLSKLNVGVIKNFKENEAFWNSYHTPIDTFFEFFYDNFLKANQQEGIISYSRFVGLAIGFEKISKK
ncbi:DUF3810 domain-containing protein [Flavobacterium sp.]|uniref:DUF3810 domain-containing protein n=1 Tax=Flavobacterium sp. TaxID=239 RepID=UPI0035276D7D